MSIVITGGIATGKSTVSKIFEEFGFTVIDADKIAHKELENSKDKVVEVFGKDILSQGKIDRKKLGSVVFADEKKRYKLEEILHPLIRDRIKKEAKKAEKEGKRYIFDIPLFFESGKYEADKVLVVYAPKQMQLQRIIKRDKLLAKDAQRRIDAQMDIEEKRLKADIVIDNTKDLKHLKNEVKNAIFKI